MKPIICIIIMLTVGPIIAASGLILYDPSRWGGEINLNNIIGLALFGLISPPLWFSYIPVLVFTPVIFKRLSEKEQFYTATIKKFYAMSILYGCIVGVFVMLPFVVIAASKSVDVSLNWLWSGVFAGGITLPIISSIYRLRNPERLKKPKVAT